jgi:hypothetical protein
MSLSRERFIRIPKTSKVSTETGEATKLQWPTKARRTKKLKAIKARAIKADDTKESTPHPFSRLPAEPHARIWAIALHDQIEQTPPPSNIFGHRYDSNVIVIHQHKGNQEFSVESSRGCPTYSLSTAKLVRKPPELTEAHGIH